MFAGEKKRNSRRARTVPDSVTIPDTMPKTDKVEDKLSIADLDKLKTGESGRPDNLIIAYRLTTERDKQYPGRGGIAEFVRQAKIQSATYYPLERGDRIPQITTLKKIAITLGVEVEYLLSYPKNWDTIKWEVYRDKYPGEFAKRYFDGVPVPAAQPTTGELPESIYQKLQKQVSGDDTVANHFAEMAVHHLKDVQEVTNLLMAARLTLPEAQFEATVRDIASYLKVRLVNITDSK